MLAMTDGEIQGSVSKPDDRKPSIYGKFGFDKKFGDIRARLTGSFYTTKSSISNTLYGGDRTGSKLPVRNGALERNLDWQRILWPYQPWL